MIRIYILGIITGVSFALTFNMLYSVVLQPSKPAPQKSNFEVVANYEGCDIIRWENSMFAEYKYFLMCKDK